MVPAETGESASVEERCVDKHLERVTAFGRLGYEPCMGTSVLQHLELGWRSHATRYPPATRLYRERGKCCLVSTRRGCDSDWGPVCEVPAVQWGSA